MDDKVVFRDIKGVPYYERKPTNADRIRSMIDEELAKFLYIKTCEDGYPMFDTISAWLEWLKTEAD